MSWSAICAAPVFSIGVELVTDRTTLAPATAQTARLVNALRERRILISASGPYANVLKIRPPLCFTQDQASQLLEGLNSTLATAD